MTTVHLDKIDKRILSILLQNSRLSYTVIGRMVRLSAPSVERRISRLYSEGAIIILFANVNLFKLGRRPYRLYFKFDSMDKETETEILGLFNACPQTGWGMIGEGEYDVLWRIDARNERDVELAMSTMTERFGTRILEKSLTITTLHAYLPWNKALGGERKVVHPGKKYDLAEKIDNFDWAILRILYDNSRSTTVEIAKKIGLSPDAVQVRVRNLIKKGIILGFSAYLDARKLGFDYYKILISFRDISTADEEKFVQFCIQNDDIVFLNKTLGSWDIELDIITRNNLELHSFMCALKEKFGNFISKHKYMSAIDERMPNPLR